ncbi:two-component sensor histidine kinase [Brevibacillus reuszeri]|uniref:histidine kinase n=1 Tax=Brevibacillus reuszeri TaxID=54915 RepID=A0A0K9YKJ9_9BACL|nr:HAMP domain-containing sensor histidine kinase [Brevibacillus reuszeri]KNB69283.1 histidine kinase [Brevibacillus reuszeri]MED1860229.1 HAMP domain-containing sensor histidine kinase [Brevibacillus reuszeri]GED71572.1 two-component sensor histidine kinase [Brevibacillus reuszeri]
MSIKTRLLLSYIAMIVVPVVCFGLVAAWLAPSFWGDQFPSGKESRKPVFRESLTKREELFAGITFIAGYDADRLLKPDILNETDEKLRSLGGALIVAKNGSVLFASPAIESADVSAYMKAAVEERGRNGWQQLNKEGYSVESHDFTFGDRSKGTVYFLSDSRSMFITGMYFFATMMLTLLVIVALTNGVLTFLVSRSIIKPLYALKKAANEIKEGNLDRPVLLKRTDELGELGAAFEEMRVRLYESIRLQLQYEDNRKELISSISHDLKTPITGIKACVEAMQDGITDTQAKREKYVNMIAIKTEQMDRLIDELFLFSRLDLNKLPFQLELVEMTKYLASIIDELRLDPRMEGVELVLSNHAGIELQVMADREKLHRVLMNIVDNSLKYMDKDEKWIRMEVQAGERAATISLEDNGTGINQEALPNIFDRFYRADPSRNTTMGGGGLGLAIAKQMIEGQGGTIWAQSERGHGTRISFTLPYQESSGGDSR